MDSKTLAASAGEASRLGDIAEAAGAGQLCWYAEAGPRARRAFWSCKVGYMLDGMDT